MHGKGTYIWTDGMQYSGDMTNNQITGYGRYEWPDKRLLAKHGFGLTK